MESFLVGACGMTQKEAALTSLREYIQRREAKDKEMRDKWEIARWMEWQQLLLSPNVPQHKKPRTPQAFCRFPWDEPERVVTKEQCHITADVLKWLDEKKQRYYNKDN